VRYPARGIGALWDPVPAPTSSAVADLLGERRAQLLVLLRAPHTTGELARRFAVTPSAISQHLSALRAAGLVSSERLGRQRLHMTSRLGQELLGPARQGVSATAASGVATRNVKLSTT
jgi:DNA-binding transcriptional ArsR family regulator